MSYLWCPQSNSFNQVNTTLTHYLSSLCRSITLRTLAVLERDGVHSWNTISGSSGDVTTIRRLLGLVRAGNFSVDSAHIWSRHGPCNRAAQLRSSKSRWRLEKGTTTRRSVVHLVSQVCAEALVVQLRTERVGRYRRNVLVVESVLSRRVGWSPQGLECYGVRVVIKDFGRQHVAPRLRVVTAYPIRSL